MFPIEYVLVPMYMYIGNPQQDTIPNPFHNDENDNDHFKNKKA